MLDFRVLGPIEIGADGGFLSLAGQRQRALLADLLLHAGEVVSTDRLVEDLWGERPPRTASTSLQNAISQLRKLIGAELLVTRRPGYSLAVPPEAIDARRFERLLEEARAGGAEERARKLRAALELWRGPPLADVAYEPFAQGEIRRLEELRLAALEDRIEADLELGRHAEVVAELEALVAANPLRERLRGLAMLALYRTGRQAEALQAYLDARHALVEELGIDPSPELQELYGSILRQEVRLRPAGARAADESEAEIARALASGRVVPVLGRGSSAELARRLAAAFGYADDGRDLARVAQHVAALQGPGPLHDALRELLASTAAPAVARFVASLPALLRARGAPPPLVVTTHYDLTLDSALAEAGEAVDVVSYVAAGRDRGRFRHCPPDAEPRLIEEPNTYVDLPGERPVVLKLCGQLETGQAAGWEGLVVTEDDYIDYAAIADLAALVPVGLAARLRRSHLLFLGYGMAEWPARLVLSRAWGGGGLAYRSWAVQPSPTDVEAALWRRYGVELVPAEPDEYVELLAGHLEAL